MRIVRLQSELKKMRKTSAATNPQNLPKKISALSATEFFEDRRAKTDRKIFRWILNRKGGERPRPGDER
jgi:hypothetical protein